jgi:hypothetical protein
LQEKYWKDPKNVREAFVGFAKDNKFDPYTSSEWYMVTNQQVQSIKVRTSLLFSFRNFFIVPKKYVFSLWRKHIKYNCQCVPVITVGEIKIPISEIMG